MYKMLYAAAWVMAVLTLCSCQSSGKKECCRDSNGAANTLSELEKRDGWVLLFDGRTTQGWRGIGKAEFPATGWAVEDGMLVVNPQGKKHRGGDIITVEKYGQFELSLDFKLTHGANSGIKYFIEEERVSRPGSGVGPEYQILDDANHPDADKGKPGTRKTASLYDLISAGKKTMHPAGQWNHVRIVSRGNHMEHWLNGKKVLEYDRGGEAFAKAVAQSKFAKIEGFGLAQRGHILLQDHEDTVYFRNIKIRTF